MAKFTVYYGKNGSLKTANDQPDFNEITDPGMAELISNRCGIAYLVSYVSQTLGWQVVDYPAQVDDGFVVFETEKLNLRQTMCVRVHVKSTRKIVIVSAMSLDYDNRLLLPNAKFASLAALNATLLTSGWHLMNNPHNPISPGQFRLWYVYEDPAITKSKSQHQKV